MDSGNATRITAGTSMVGINAFCFVLALAYSGVLPLIYWPLFFLEGEPVQVGPLLPTSAIESIEIGSALVFFLMFYGLGKKAGFHGYGFDNAALIYAGVVLGSLAGLVGIQTTTNGNTITSRTLLLNATPFDLVQLLINASIGFGVLFGGFAVASIRTWSVEERTVTKSMARLSLLASILVFASYLAYGLAFRAAVSPISFMPPPFYLVQSARDLIFPVLFFLALYFLGSRVDALKGYSSLLALLAAGCVAATLLGFAIQDYVSYGFSSTSYFSSDRLIAAVSGGVFAAFLGFTAVYISNIRSRSSEAPTPAILESQDETQR